MTSFSYRYLSGAYDEEHDTQGAFRWLSDCVSLDIVGSGLLLLCGESPSHGRVTIATNQASFQVEVSPKGQTILAVPLAKTPQPQRVTFNFSDSLALPGETRTLCFQLRELQLKTLQTAQDAAWRSPLPLIAGKGLPVGNRSPTFANGWLRMNARRVDKDSLQVSGILVPPLHQQEAVVLTANGKPLETLEYGLFNSDYAFLGKVAFEGCIDLADDLAAHETVEIGSIRFGASFQRDLNPAIPWYQDWTYPLEETSLPLPDSQNMQRIGASDSEWFIFSGMSFVEKLEDICKRFLKSYQSPQALAILDWGCGCGRLSRHLIAKGYGHIHGIDIDPLNIDWCKKHLAGATFDLVEPQTPSLLAPEQFDVVIGHSVFTHLTELDQFLWLVELNRVLAPNGLAVVTVMANFSTAIEDFSPDRFAELMNRGFLDVGWQNDGVDSQAPGYYRRIFHTIDYVRQSWAYFFEIVGVLEGFSDHQAAIVLRKTT